MHAETRWCGKLLYVDGSQQTGGTLLAMSAEHLTEGTGMHITGDDLVTGSLIKLSSKSTKQRYIAYGYK